ncbi:MAG TPA: polysaccharide deacetylase family protein [Actinomycetota bacterium]
MAEQFSFPSRGLPPALADRRGFLGFCAAMVALILVLAAFSPIRTRDTAAAQEPGPIGHHNSPKHGKAGGAVGNGVADSPSATPTADAEESALLWLIEAGEPVHCGAGTQPLVALTFDDGPGAYTQETIDLLKANGMTATFFTAGKLYSSPQFDGLLKEEAEMGVVGDHTWDHVPLDGMTQDELEYQIIHTREVAEADTGDSVVLFRPPLGRHDATLDEFLRAHGMLDVLWSLYSQDSQGASASQIYQNLVDGLSPGDIVLLHENRGTTLDALPQIIELIKERGLQTVTVPELLTMDPPSMEQLQAHTCN